MVGACSTIHSTERALPAMSLNSLVGSRDRMSVADRRFVSFAYGRMKCKVRTSEDHTQVSRAH